MSSLVSKDTTSPISSTIPVNICRCQDGLVGSCGGANEWMDGRRNDSRMSFILMGRVVVEDKQAAVMSDMMIERAEEGH